MRTLATTVLLLLVLAVGAGAYVIDGIATSSNYVKFGVVDVNQRMPLNSPFTVNKLGVYDVQITKYSIIYTTTPREVWQLAVIVAITYPGDTVNLKLWSTDTEGLPSGWRIENWYNKQIVGQGLIGVSTEAEPFASVTLPAPRGTTLYYNLVLVPEPGCIATLIAGVGGLGVLALRRRR